MPTHKFTTPDAAWESLRAKGHSLRSAAPLLGVHFSHLHQVLQGRRESRRLMRAIESIPARGTTKPAAR